MDLSGRRAEHETRATGCATDRPRTSTAACTDRWAATRRDDLKHGPIAAPSTVAYAASVESISVGGWQGIESDQDHKAGTLRYILVKGPAAERPNDRRAREIVSTVVRVPVCRFEDGTADGQVDARVHYPDRLAALEIVAGSCAAKRPVGVSGFGDHPPARTKCVTMRLAHETMVVKPPATSRLRDARPPRAVSQVSGRHDQLQQHRACFPSTTTAEITSRASDMARLQDQQRCQVCPATAANYVAQQSPPGAPVFGLMGLQQRLVEASCCPSPLPVSTLFRLAFEVYD